MAASYKLNSNTIYRRLTPQDYRDLRKTVPARRAAEDSTSSTARWCNDAGAVLRKSYLSFIRQWAAGRHHVARQLKFLESGIALTPASDVTLDCA